MERAVNFKESLEKLISVSRTGTREDIEKAEIETIWEASNLFEFVVNYIFLDSIGFHFPFGSKTIKKGTILYRIRDCSDNTDFSNPSEWAPSPYKKQNRANKEGQEAIYLASSELLCFLETHKKVNDRYVLGRYECTEDFTVGGFFGKNSFSNLEWLAADVLNAFFIAPSRNERNKELFMYLDDKIGCITPDDLSSLKECILEAKEEMTLPYKFAVLNQKDKYYNITNQLCEIIEKDYPCGIQYSSCYIPIGNPFINCSEYNLALYSPALSCIRFINYSVKTFEIKNKENFTDVSLAKILLGDYKNEQTGTTD